MPSTPHSAPVPGIRRLTRTALAASLVAALSVAGPFVMASAADESPTADLPAGDLKSAHDKLGSEDADLLAEAKAGDAKNVTMMIATAPGRTEQVAAQLDAVKGGSVGRTYDKLGYVRATVPTGRADAAIAAATKLSSVRAIDLRQQIQIEDPTKGADTARGAKSSPTAATYAAPDKNTPAENPYNPTFETGAVDFVKKNPKADGRGITIGVLDTGVDPTHPALQRTTTGDRKVTDWVTSTDPVIDGDGTWRSMTTSVSGPAFTYGGQNWKASEGSYRINVFRESVTSVTDTKGDVNRDGDTTDAWGVLYDEAAGTVTVDVNGNNDFTDDTPMKPYKDGHQIGFFGTDDPSTDVAERMPFVVTIRKDVPTDPWGGDWVGKKADFVNIGMETVSHGTHVAGVAAANGLFGGRMNGAAPGAKIVSSRACATSFCSDVARTEGMIDLVVNRGVDIVNMSIGGQRRLNDGSSVKAQLYNRLIDTYGVQIVVGAGNSGPGANTISDPALADQVISVGAGISKQTWAANYGSAVKKQYALFPFSSRGPREDGGLTPTLVAPGSAVSAIATWLPGESYTTSGWKLPAGYATYNGTSMASPAAAGASALLLSAAKRQHIDLTPAALRTAVTSTARHIKDVQAYEEGAGRIDIQTAWKAIEAGASAHEYTVRAPVDTVLSPALKTPGIGTGIYDREGGLQPGKKRTYDVTITRTTGPEGTVPHTLRLKNNKARTFSILGPRHVALPLNRPVTVQVQAAPSSAGIKSARLEVDDPRTVGTDKQILATVVVSTPVKYTYSVSDSVQRNSHRSYFVTVPKGAKALQVTLDGMQDLTWTEYNVIDPYGMVMKWENPEVWDKVAYKDPHPGVYEIDFQTYWGRKTFDSSYDLHVSVLGAPFGPDPVTVPDAHVGAPVPVSWTVTNQYAPVDGTLRDGPLGSSKTARPTITNKATQTSTVEVPEGTTSLEVAVGGVSDPAADLDLFVYDAEGSLVGQSAVDGPEESVSVADPVAGTYTIEVYGYDVPSGSTAYDYRDVFFSTTFGSLTVDHSTSVKFGTGESARVTANVTAAAAAPAGRELFGQVRLVNDQGTVAGVGTVRIEKVTP